MLESKLDNNLHITSRFDYGAQLLVFVDIFTVLSGKQMLVGRTVFDVENVLSTTHKIKARRLRKNRCM